MLTLNDRSQENELTPDSDMPQLHYILASGSPQRKMLLESAGYQFDILPPHESAESGICSQCGPAELVLKLAVAKGVDVVQQIRASSHQAQFPAVLIACDTVAECEGTILGKPRDEDHARDMLERLKGKRHRVYSGLCLWPLRNCSDRSAPNTRVAITELEMANLADNEIEEYLESGLWQGKAGGFGYQDRLDWLQIVSGSESNVIGLPLELLSQMVEQISIEPNNEGHL